MGTVTQIAEIQGFSSESIVDNGITLHYWSGGDRNGDPVILWHGSRHRIRLERCRTSACEGGSLCLGPRYARLRR